MSRHTLLLIAGAPIFCLLVLLNVGGYRYGVSDQAFYIPVVLRGLDPSLYPHDAPLLAVQNQLLAFDDWFSSIVAMSGVSVPAAFFVSYLAGLSLLYAAAVSIGRTVYRTWWGVGAFVVALTIRHRITDTAVNTLESYLHPRILAFAVGLTAVAIFLRGRTRIACLTVVVALLLHPTTAIWFAVWIGVAALISDRSSRDWLLAIAGVTVIAGVFLLVNTFRDQLVVMDETWSSVLQSKDYLVATDWPLVTWFAHLGSALIIAAIYRYRHALRCTTERETGLVVGSAVLLLIFLVSVPLSAAGLALIVQLQFNRVFWLLDIFAICYAVWLLVESPLSIHGVGRPVAGAFSAPRARRVVVAALVAATVVRGGYVMGIERAGHPLVQVNLSATDWTAVMMWAGERPVGTHFLADPGHAWRYGSSVRAASGRDVYLEEIKDIGIAIYSSTVAHRIAERIADLGDFSTLDASRARRLARRYNLHYLITEHSLDLPRAHRHGRFTVYDLRADHRVASTTSLSPLH